MEHLPLGGGVEAQTCRNVQPVGKVDALHREIEARSHMGFNAGIHRLRTEEQLRYRNAVLAVEMIEGPLQLELDALERLLSPLDGVLHDLVDPHIEAAGEIELLPVVHGEEARIAL